MDAVISQLDQNYLQQIIQYQKIISQRNALLKYFALNHTFDLDTLTIYNEQLENLGSPIFEKRKEFIKNFVPVFNKFHQIISGNSEEVNLVYESQLHENSTLELLNTNLNKDRALQYTSVGVHKDDLSFLIESYPIKKFGSQGQQKSFLIALKLAQFDVLKKKSGEKPILLLDDIFDKLDESRVEKIIEMVNNDEFGQLFVSDTHSERTENIVKTTHQSYKIFSL